MRPAKQPKCPECKGTFFEFDYEAQLCVSCKPYDINAEPFIPGKSLDDAARYADMDNYEMQEN